MAISTNVWRDKGALVNSRLMAKVHSPTWLKNKLMNPKPDGVHLRCSTKEIRARK